MHTTKRKLLIIPLLLLIPVILIFVIAYFRRIPANPPGTVGNTAGNLNNGGLFCEHNGTVYFSNKADGGNLYAMDVNEGNIRRLNTQEVRNILAGGSYLYFFQSGPSNSSGFGSFNGIKSFSRCKLNGKSSTVLTTDAVVTGQLVDNSLYLLTNQPSGASFYKISTNASEKTVLSDSPINPACARDGVIYYQGTGDDHYLYALNTKTDVASEVWQGNLWYPVVEGDYVYYLDVAENYRLCRYSMSRDAIQILTEDRVDCFNVGNGYIYYQKNGADAQLKCMNTDGTNVVTVAVGNYTNINMTSQYVYFQAFGDDTSMYHSPLGSGACSGFAPVSE